VFVVRELSTKNPLSSPLHATVVMMRSSNLVLVMLTAILVPLRAQDAGDGGIKAEECTCSGLDYVDGGSYLMNANSDDEFTFTSVFEGLSFSHRVVNKGD
jgi:hypothetical protein